MGNLFTSVLNTANAIRVYDRQLSTIQNNVANANTPGYVRQVQTLSAMRFDIDSGLPGGVSAGPVMNTRSEYAEQSVRYQFTRQGYSYQKASELSRIERLFDPSASYGVAGTVTNFFKTFSQLSVNPNDHVARSAVIEAAGTMASAFNETAAGLASAAHEADKQIADTVSAINRIGAQIRDINSIYRGNSSSTSDAGLDSKLNAALEDLSELTDFSIIRSEDGTMGVYIAGQTPLVVGDHDFPLGTDFSSPQSAILDSSGGDITNQIHQGKLGALLDQKNKTLPSFSSDLNTLAQTLAEQVNGQLAAGVDANGAAPTVDLFEWNPVQGPALSLQVTQITPEQIAAATPEAPGGNGNALTLAGMLQDKTLDGFTFVEYFGSLGGRVGRELATAKEPSPSRSNQPTPPP